MTTSHQRDRIENADCIQGMAGLPDGHVDLVVTDPPFAIDFKARRANYNRTSSRVLEGYREIAPEDYPGFTRAWMEQVHRVLKETGSCFVFSGWNNLKDILVAADDVGLKTVNHIIWKYQFGVATKRRFVTSHYHCLYYCKDDKKRRFFPEGRFPKGSGGNGDGSARYRDMEDVWMIPREYWTGETKTPTKLPYEIIAKILAYASEKGDTVLDPFLGSGQVAVVSKLLGRHWLGFEIVPEYHRFAQDRLDRETTYRGGTRNGGEERQASLSLFG